MIKFVEIGYLSEIQVKTMKGYKATFYSYVKRTIYLKYLTTDRNYFGYHLFRLLSNYLKPSNATYHSKRSYNNITKMHT